jgi:hypothetical protein
MNTILSPGNSKDSHHSNDIPNVVRTSKAINITYYDNNKKYMVCIPFSRVKVSKTVGYKAELIYCDGRRLDITHQPGIPYLISATNLGGLAIEIKNSFNEKIFQYHENVIPGYAIELED